MPPKPMNDEQPTEVINKISEVLLSELFPPDKALMIFKIVLTDLCQTGVQARLEERKALIEKIKTEVIGEDEYSNEAYKMCDDPECECRQEDGEYSVKNNFRAEQRIKLAQLEKEEE